MMSVDRLTVPSAASLLDVLHVIDTGAVGLALLVDVGRLVAVMTDGDVRRAILRGQSLDSPALPHASGSFRRVVPETSRNEAMDLMKAFTIEHLPIVDADGMLVGLHLLNDLIHPEPLPNAAMILAGGKGTRLGTLTKTTPKPMVPVAGRPILERILLHLIGGGIRRVYLSVNYLADVIENHFGDGERFGCEIEYLREDQPLGTGGPLALLPPDTTSSPVMVMNGDLITDFDVAGMFHHHRRRGNAITVGVKSYGHEVPFGCLKTDGDRVRELVEKPILRQTINAGVYVFEPAVVREVRPVFTPITEPIVEALRRDRRVGTFAIDDWIDIGRPDQLSSARGEATGESA